MWKQTFGQSKLIEQLRKAVQNNCLAHALLLTGPAGVGKTRVATGLLMALNCASIEPCEECVSCKKIVSKTHPDIFWIAPEEGKESIPIEPLRILQTKLHMRPLEGKAQCILIEPAHAMTLAASNALLKILEEPPADTFFLLVTDKPYFLPATLRSRCQKFWLGPLSSNQVEASLKTKGKVPDKNLIHLSQGSIARALQWDWEWAQNLFAEVLKLWESPTPSCILETAERWSQEEERIPFILELLTALWHDALLETSEDRGHKIFSEAKTLLHQHLVLQGPASLWQKWQTLVSAPKDLEHYANKQLLLENVLFSLTQTV